MTKFKTDDKVWWLHETLDGVKLYPVVIVNPNEGFRARVQLRGGDRCCVFRHELHHSHAEAMQALMELDGFKFHEAHREQGWQ